MFVLTHLYFSQFLLNVIFSKFLGNTLVKEGLPFARDLSLENSADFYLCFQLALLHSVSYFFFLYQSPISSSCTVFDTISPNIDKVLSINLPANVFLFGGKHKDWLTYSGGTDSPGELCYSCLK